LWFDESYDEAYYKLDSARRAAARASLLFVIGTTGQTSLPLHVAELAAKNGAALIVLNPEPNPFSELARRVTHGVYFQTTACGELPIRDAALAKDAVLSNAVLNNDAVLSSSAVLNNDAVLANDTGRSNAVLGQVAKSDLDLLNQPSSAVPVVARAIIDAFGGATRY
jgi:uncharacterized phosphosugar-binding protein